MKGNWTTFFFKKKVNLKQVIQILIQEKYQGDSTDLKPKYFHKFLKEIDVMTFETLE
jgi:hypothetical protein